MDIYNIHTRKHGGESYGSRNSNRRGQICRQHGDEIESNRAHQEQAVQRAIEKKMLLTRTPIMKKGQNQRRTLWERKENATQPRRGSMSFQSIPMLWIPPAAVPDGGS